MLATLVIERGGETLVRQPLVNSMTSDFNALWSPDETKVAVRTGPFPQHYEVFVFDLGKREAVFSLEDDTASAWRQAALDYFKAHAKARWASAEGHDILPYPVKWKDDRTLEVNFSLLGWDKGTSALPLGCSVSGDARFERDQWKLGPFRNFKLEPED